MLKKFRDWIINVVFPSCDPKVEPLSTHELSEYPWWDGYRLRWGSGNQKPYKPLLRKNY